jgi:hypothetical protein
MPRLLAISQKLLVAALVWASAGALAILRADPPNPLRPSEFTSGAVRIVPLPTTASAATRLIADDEPQPQVPSIVENRLAQPELIPAPNPTASELSDYFGPPELTDPAPWQHMVHPLFAEPWFSHSDPNDPDRHIGIGQPLIGTSWRNRPIYFGTFVGGIMMDDLVPGRIYQNDTTFIGARLGYDFDHFWGMEGRWAFARPDLANGATGAPFFPASRDNFADVSLVFYPLGDTRWRPYILGGLGFQTFRFNNELGQRISEATFEIPLGAGIKYFYGPWFTLRFDFVDNLSVGNARISGMHNISLMTGAELRFGGRRPSYFPWHSNTTYW